MMADDVPAEFDPAWYGARYPDVGLSGLGPREHYRRFGRHMGRSANGRGETRSATNAARNPPSPVEEFPPTMSAPIAAPQPPSSIIERPTDFDVEKLRVLPASSTADREAVSIDELAGAFLQTGNASSNAAVIAYASLLRLDMTAASTLEASVSCGDAFRSGPTRIENAWFADRSRLRLMLAGATNNQSDAEPLALRAYQPDSANRGVLVSIDAGVQIPEFEPVFHDLQLIQPLMPILLELSDETGARTFELVPFPSLLPGGLHCAELKALQTETNPMDDFWSLSDALLREAIGSPDSPDRSIATVTWESARQLPLAAELDEWLRVVFGVRGSGTEEREESRAGPDEALDRLDLALPTDFVPTVSAMVSRPVSVGDSDILSGPYLIADAETFRPRWSIVPPAGEEPWHNAPLLRPRAPVSGGKSAVKPAPFHLGIGLRRPTAIAGGKISAEPKEAIEATPVALRKPISVVVDLSDVSRTEALLGAIRQTTGDSPLEILIRLAGDRETMRSELDRICGTRGWSAVPHGVDLREVARNVKHEILLSISDLIRLDDPEALATLDSMLHHDASAGSVSCALLGETIVKRQTVLQPACGGLFPAGVSFATSPRLSFREPDVLQALPHQTYPVVANTMLLAMFRKDAIASLPQLSRPVPAMAADIRLGLDLMEAGRRNWCTTKTTATLMGDYARRDAIDPVGGRYVDPNRWGELLPRITLVRELF